MLDNLLNFVSLFAWILFLLFLVYSFIKAFHEGGIREAIKVLTTRRILGALFLVLAITLLSGALVFIEPQEVGVVVSVISRDGYREAPFRSGLHWIVPLAERVEKYPIYWQNYTMSSDPLEGNRIGDDSIAARTSDGQSVFVDSSVIYRLDANDIIRLHIDLQNRYVDDFIRPMLRGIIRTEVSQFTADEVNSSKRKILESNLDNLSREAFSAKGIILDRFLLRNIAFSPEYATAIERKQVAEQERTQKEYEAEQMRKLAEGVRDKQKLEAQGKAEALILEGRAAADVVLLKAKAEAEALKLINEILSRNEQLITYRYVEKLGAGIKVMLVPNDNPYLLPLPDISSESLAEPSTLLSPYPIITEPISVSPSETPALTITPTLTSTPIPTIGP